MDVDCRTGVGLIPLGCNKAGNHPRDNLVSEQSYIRDQMAGGSSNYNELKERVAALEKLLEKVENTEDAASVIARIQDVNTELARFREIMTLKTTGYDEFHLGTLT